MRAFLGEAEHVLPYLGRFGNQPHVDLCPAAGGYTESQMDTMSLIPQDQPKTLGGDPPGQDSWTSARHEHANFLFLDIVRIHVGCRSTIRGWDHVLENGPFSEFA